LLGNIREISIYTAAVAKLNAEVLLIAEKTSKVVETIFLLILWSAYGECPHTAHQKEHKK
jgi:hypothetical protein